MPRPPLQLETWGKIRRTVVDGKPTAVAYYRDSDGVTRKMQRSGRTGAEAERNLVAAMKARLAPSSDDLTRESRLRDLAEAWYAESASEGNLAQGSLNTYRRSIDTIVLKGLGEVRLHEATVPRVDRFLKAVTARNGAAQARTARVVLKGMFDLAVRHGAIAINPASAAAPVRTKRKPVVAPTVADVRAIQQLMRDYDAGTDKQGRKRWTDLSDVTDLYVATGARTAEILALGWASVYFERTPAQLVITGTVIEGDDGKLVIQEHPKSEASARGLLLPPFAVETLMRRRVDSISELVFPSAAGTPRWPSNVRRQWRDALKGSPYEGITPRDFRKAVATLLRDNYGIEAAQLQLGHSSDAVTRKHYVPVVNQGPDATAALEESFGKTASK